MKSIREQSVLITGSTDGIGKIAAMHLALMGATVFIHGRDPEKCRTVRDEIWKASGNPKVKYFLADFSSLHDIVHMASAFGEIQNHLDVLINNAGIYPAANEDPNRHLSAQEYDLCFSVNYLAPFLLTHLLLPSLRAAPSARIINVTSISQEAIDFDDLMTFKNYSALRAYARSKLALTMFTFELHQMLKEENITVNCVHPGSLLDTKMIRHIPWEPLGNAETGADSEVYLATAPELEGVSGSYFDGKTPARAHEQAYDPEARQMLWRISLELTDLKKSA
jgi:NAD(P)-dependent dehydrogenase (short-subunit alcohol dehydrogenase family)